jgi:hypothetical protein
MPYPGTDMPEIGLMMPHPGHTFLKNSIKMEAVFIRFFEKPHFV